MGKFTFNLESLFEHRTRLMELRQKEFGEALRRLEEEREKLAALRDVYARTSRDLDELKERSGQTPELGLYHAYLTRVRNTIAGQEEFVSGLAAEFEEKRKTLLDATKDKQAVEKMKEKSYERFVKDQDRQEQKVMDDIANAKAARNGK